jgi:hypothetical protein
MSSLSTSPSFFQIQRDGNNQEYVETCDDWVRATLVIFEGSPHIRIQEHHERGSGRLHLGPLIPLDQWLTFKGAVDTLVGPSLRHPQVMKRTLSKKIEYAILENVAAINQRQLQITIGSWFNRVRERVTEPFDHTDLLFAFKRLWEWRYLELKKLDGTQYSGSEIDDSSFFFDKEFHVAATPMGWSYWESIKT